MPPKRPSLTLDQVVDKKTDVVTASGASHLETAKDSPPALSRANGGTSGHNEAMIIPLTGDDGIERRFYRKTTLLKECTSASSASLLKEDTDGHDTNTQAQEMLLHRIQNLLWQYPGLPYPQFRAVGMDYFQSEMLPGACNLREFIERYRKPIKAADPSKSTTTRDEFSDITHALSDDDLYLSASITSPPSAAIGEPPSVMNLAHSVALRAILLLDGDCKTDNFVIIPDKVIPKTQTPAPGCTFYAIAIDGEKIFDSKVFPSTESQTDQINACRSVDGIASSLQISLSRAESRSSIRLSREELSSQRELIKRMLNISEIELLFDAIVRNREEIITISEACFSGTEHEDLTARIAENLTYIEEAIALVKAQTSTTERRAGVTRLSLPTDLLTEDSGPLTVTTGGAAAPRSVATAFAPPTSFKSSSSPVGSYMSQHRTDGNEKKSFVDIVDSGRNAARSGKAI